MTAYSTKDGTLTDSIAAVEAAWHKVADEIGQDPKYVIAATHGKRAIDNLCQFKPHLKAHELEDEVARFEESILFFADAHALHGPGSGLPSRPPSIASSFGENTEVFSTPALTPTMSVSPSSTASDSQELLSSSSPQSPVGENSFLRRLHKMLSIAAHFRIYPEKKPSVLDVDLADLVGEEIAEEVLPIVPLEQVRLDVLEAWQVEAAKVDRSVRILPGVKKLMDSIPTGRYAVATSGAKTYGEP